MKNRRYVCLYRGAIVFETPSKVAAKVYRRARGSNEIEVAELKTLKAATKDPKAKVTESVT